MRVTRIEPLPEWAVVIVGPLADAVRAAGEVTHCPLRDAAEIGVNASRIHAYVHAERDALAAWKARTDAGEWPPAGGLIGFVART